MIATLVCSREEAVILRDDIIFQLAHRLKRHACGFRKCMGCTAQGLLGRTVEEAAFLIEIVAKHAQRGNLGERIDKGRTKTRDNIQVAVASLNERGEQARTVYPFACRQDSFQILTIVNHEIQRFHASVFCRIHEVHHTDFFLLDIVQNVGFGKLCGRLLQEHHEGIGVHLDFFVHSLGAFYDIDV